MRRSVVLVLALVVSLGALFAQDREAARPGPRQEQASGQRTPRQSPQAPVRGGKRQVRRMTPAERWAALPAERKEQLRARWRQVRSLPPEERARLRRVASRLLSLERGLPEELGAEERERLKGLDPAERREVVRDLVLSRAASEARSALRRLPPEVATRLDELSPEQRRQELTRARESRLGRLLDAMVDQPGRFRLDPELVEPLRGLDLEARKQSLLVLLRERVLERVDEVGGDPDLSRERLEAMEPEAFARGLLRRLDGDPRVRGLLLGQEGDRPRPERERGERRDGTDRDGRPNVRRLHAALEIQPDDLLPPEGASNQDRRRHALGRQRARVLRVLEEDGLVSAEELERLRAAPDQEVVQIASRLAAGRRQRRGPRGR